MHFFSPRAMLGSRNGPWRRARRLAVVIAALVVAVTAPGGPLIASRPDRTFIAPSSDGQSDARTIDRPVARPAFARPFEDDWSVRLYDGHGGLPSNTVLGLLYDTTGYLWAVTDVGLASYNGRTWRAPEMFDDTVLLTGTSLVRSDGSLWFGTLHNGLVRLLDGQWSAEIKTGLPNGHVTSLLESKGEGGSSVLWIGTKGGLARLEGGQLVTYDSTSGLPDNSVLCLLEGQAQDGSRVLWVGTDRGLARFERGQWTTFDTSSGLPDDTIQCLVECVAADGSRALWVGTNSGLARLELGQWTTFDTSSGLPDNRVLSLAESDGIDGSRGLWVGTSGGLARFEREQCHAFMGPSGLLKNEVTSLLESRAENGSRVLWAGIAGHGLAKLSRNQWTFLDASAGLPNNYVRCMLETDAEDGSRALWVGTSSGLARFERGRRTTFDASSGLPDAEVVSILASKGDDGSGLLWVGTLGGLARYSPSARSPWTTFDTSSGLPNNHVRCIVERANRDGSRTLWVGTVDGLARLQNGRWTSFDASRSGIPNNYVSSLLEDRMENGSDAIWVGTWGGGLARFADGRWTVVDTSSGLPDNYVTSLLEGKAEDGSRVLWVGTYRGGVAWRNLSVESSPWNFLSPTTTPAISDRCIYQIRQDLRGRIYLSTNKGVVRLTPRIPTSEDHAEFSVHTFTTDDGLPNNEGNSGASMIDALGRIWIGTPSGAAIFDPSNEFEDRTPKPLLVERILVNDASRHVAEGDSLRYDENDLQFEVALLSYVRESDTRYRTQLEGYDEKSTDWTPDGRRVFTNLPYGSYSFTVWGRDSVGNVSGPVRKSFRIEPAPWQTWWAYLFYAAGAFGVVAGAVQFRSRTFRRRQHELEQLVDVRTAALADAEARAREQSEALARTVEQLKISEQSAVEAWEEAVENERHALASEAAALEANHAKSDFLASMSHELRTPLNAVLGFAQLMEREGGLSPSHVEHLAIIERSGEHLLGLINDVLSLAKIEAGKLTLTENSFDLVALLRDVEAMVRVRAESKGLRLLCDLDESLPHSVRGDDGKLRQVLLNLLGNAVKFTDHGSVSLRAGWSAGRARFEVEDTGFGIAEEELAGLFEVFVQTESGRKSDGGTGLGLVISRQLVRLMGGDIVVRSTQGQGSTFGFDVDLPRSLETGQVGRERVVGLDVGQEPPRILVVDDVTENRLLLMRLLSSVGCVVREAANGREAIECWDDWRPGLIWMDMRMPVMDGYEATRFIRTRESDAPAGLSTRIIAVTASAFEHDREKILAQGCDDFVTKPFREETIFQKITQHLGTRFLVEEALGQSPAAPGITLEAALTPERLLALNTGLRTALADAVRIGDVDGALRSADTIRLVDEPLAAELSHAIKAFEFTRLGDLLDSLRASER